MLAWRFWVCTLRFHGVRTSLPLRSGTALTDYRQNRNEVFVMCTFCFQEYPIRLWHQSVKMTMLKTSGCLQPWPDSSLPPALCLYRTMLAASTAIFICCAYIYTSNKPADIMKDILIHVCASDLNNVLFAFVIFKICVSFFIYFHQKNTIGRGK